MLLNLGGHGLGDCILSLQISSLLTAQNIEHVNCISTRNQVFEPLNYVFGKQFQLYQVDECVTENNNIVLDQKLQQQLKKEFSCEDLTYNVPDLLFHHPLALDFDKYNLNSQLIKKHRVLINSQNKKENIIYCGLATSTEGYLYNDIQNLLISLANALPKYQIYFPNIKTWDKEINMGNFNIQFPKNVYIDGDPKFEDSLDILLKSKYGIFTCNGPSHIAYQLGIPRLILDPQFNKLPWITRWKEDYEECIPINTPQNEISKLVFHNIQSPETTLIDRKAILNLIKNEFTDWKRIFYLKF